MEKMSDTKRYAKSCSCGVLCALVSELVLLLPAAALVSRGIVGEERCGLLAAAAAMGGAWLGCSVAAAKMGRHLALTVFCAAAFWLSNQLLGMLFYSALDPARSLMLAFAAAVGALLSLALGGSSRHRKSRSRARRRTG